MNENEKKLLDSLSENFNLFLERQTMNEKLLKSTRSSLFFSVILIVAFIMVSNLFLQKMQLKAKVLQENESDLRSKKELRAEIIGTLLGSEFLLTAQYQQCKISHDNKMLLEQKIARNNMLPNLLSISFGTSYVFSQTVEQELASYANKFEGIDNICELDIKELDNKLKKQINGIIFDMNQIIDQDAKKLSGLKIAI